MVVIVSTFFNIDKEFVVKNALFALDFHNYCFSQPGIGAKDTKKNLIIFINLVEIPI